MTANIHKLLQALFYIGINVEYLSSDESIGWKNKENPIINIIVTEYLLLQSYSLNLKMQFKIMKCQQKN